MTNPPNASRSRPIAPATIAALSAVTIGAAVLGVTLLGSRSHDDRGGASNVSGPVGTANAVGATGVVVEGSSGLMTTVRVVDESLPVHDLAEEETRRDASERDGAVSSPSGGRLDGESMIGMLPSSLIELARGTTWDERTTEALERFMLLAFDANGDGVLDDFERIVAVRALRDAMWPTDPHETNSHETGAIRFDALPIGPVLSTDDLRLFHDVDESRRLDHASHIDAALPPAGQLDPALRASVIEVFRLDDDGHLSATEYARFLRHYHAESNHADLNQDGIVDEWDLRLFLDVATPIQ